MLETRKYTLTVEGETEKWYFDWLKEQINNCKNRTFNASFDIKVSQSPRSFYKGANARTSPVVFHICDIESICSSHIEKFHAVLKEMKEANTYKNIKYNLGYSNFTFELWIILHKMDCFGCLNTRKQYLNFLRQCFEEKFEDLAHYKQEKTFKHCLSKLSLIDVFQAVRRAKKLAFVNTNNANKLIKYSGYSYYRENPSLSVYEIVEKILLECGVA